MALGLVDNVNRQQAAGTSHLSENSRCAPPAEEVDQSCMNGTMVNVEHTWQLGDSVPLIKSVINAEKLWNATPWAPQTESSRDLPLSCTGQKCEMRDTMAPVEHMSQFQITMPQIKWWTYASG